MVGSWAKFSVFSPASPKTPAARRLAALLRGGGGGAPPWASEHARLAPAEVVRPPSAATLSRRAIATPAHHGAGAPA